MAVLDEGLDAAPVEGDGGRRSFPATVADRTPGEWRSLYERQHARADRERTRADAAEARCEDLRWAEVASRSDAGWWKSRFKACRRKLSAAEDEMKELRRAARDVSSLRAEAARLEMLLSQAVGPSTGAGTIEALSKEVVRLRTALASSQARGDSAGRRSAGEARRVRTALEEARQRKDAIGTLRKEVARLNKEVVRRDKAIARLNECLEPPLLPPPSTLDEVRPLDIRTVVRGSHEGRLWNAFVARYHYLGYKTLVGAQMRYAVHGRDGWPVAMLGFSTAAWKLAPRDRFIGWTPQLREKNLPLVVDNPRVLILPWMTIPNLGSHILSLVRRRLPEDWTARYNTTPVLIETFVETPRYTGAVYKASGWIRVGTTQGRGRYDRDKLYDKPKKDIWLRPLRKDWKRTLNR